MFRSLVGCFLLIAVSNVALAAPTEIDLPISNYAKSYIKTLHPSEYQVGGFGNFSPREIQGLLETRAIDLGMEVPFGEEIIAKRAQRNGLITRCTTSSCMALTFDDGAYLWHKELDLLPTDQGIHGTHFVNGFNFNCIYDGDQVSSLRRARTQGHQIASHTWSHPRLTDLSFEEIDRQVQLLEDALLKVVGTVPAFIRPPFGSVSDEIVGYLNDKHSLVVVNWNYDSGDTRSGYQVQDGLNVYRGLRAPRHAIVLNHETVESTVKTLIPQAIGILRGNGYSTKSFVTVAEGLNLNPYKLTAPHQRRDSSWTCSGKPTPGTG